MQCIEVNVTEINGLCFHIVRLGLRRQFALAVNLWTASECSHKNVFCDNMLWRPLWAHINTICSGTVLFSSQRIFFRPVVSLLGVQGQGPHMVSHSRVCVTPLLTNIINGWRKEETHREQWERRNPANARKSHLLPHQPLSHNEHWIKATLCS